jgi:transposase
MATLARMLRASDSQRQQLERWIRAPSTPQSLVTRSRIVLLTIAGLSSKEVGRQLKISQPTIRLWQRRFRDGGPEALAQIAPGRGRKPKYGARKVQRLIEATQAAPPAGQTHWSCRSFAKVHSVSKATVQRLWNLHGLKPHLQRSFKLSRDKRFVEKLTDVVGLYLNPPDKALVLCVDEKSQIQALDRTQPGLPMKRGRCGTRTHDYLRHGTTTLFAALNVLDGKVVGQCLPRHRHQEFLKFLRHLDREFSEPLELHLIVDNYATHKHPRVKRWLEKHPRFKLHFTPTSSSWTNLVERWFRELTDKAIRRGTFVSVPDLIASIANYLRHYNAEAKPFIWTASIETILAKIKKVKAVYETLH